MSPVSQQQQAEGRAKVLFAALCSSTIFLTVEVTQIFPHPHDYPWSQPQIVLQLEATQVQVAILHP